MDFIYNLTKQRLFLKILPIQMNKHSQKFLSIFLYTENSIKREFMILKENLVQKFGTTEENFGATPGRNFYLQRNLNIMTIWMQLLMKDAQLNLKNQRHYLILRTMELRMNAWQQAVLLKL